LVAVFTEFVAYQGPACSTGHGTGGTEKRVAGDAAHYGTDTGADLGVCRVG